MNDNFYFNAAMILCLIIFIASLAGCATAPASSPCAGQFFCIN
jgi:hypothetical protein